MTVIPSNRKARREGQANPMQKKPEFQGGNGDKQAGHNSYTSLLMRQNTPDPIQLEAQRIAFEALLARTPPMKSIVNMKDLLYAMGAMNCVLITDYTTVAFCRNDQWRNGLHLEIPMNMLAILSHEFLSQWSGHGKVKEAGVQYLKDQWFKQVNTLPNYKAVWVLCQKMTPLTGDKL